MTPEEFRAAGHQLIDWIAEYRSTVEARPVRPPVAPGEVRAAFSDQPPSDTQDVAALLAELDSVIAPASTAVQHPMHFGWFPANATLSSVLGDIASSGLGALGISWESSPALTEVEQVVCDWMRQLVGLSDRWSGTIHDTASVACLTAMLLAREKATDHAQVRGGLAGSSAVAVYSTEQAHSSIQKGALLAGFGLDNLRTVRTDPWTRSMDVGDLAAKMKADSSNGIQPAIVVAGVGTTGTTAFDPVAEIVELANRFGAWVHVDAAMAGTAMLVPENRHLWEGVEGADSISWNPHKWMGTILDTSLFYVRDVEHLVRVMSTNPSYLRSSADGEVVQYRDWGIPLGRRFRALKLLFHLRLDGITSVQNRVRRDMANAQELAAWVEATEGWEVVAPVDLQTVCVRHRPSGKGFADLDAHTLRWVQDINDSGAAFLTPSMLDGEWMVRVSIGAESTERVHVERLWAMMQEAAGRSDEVAIGERLSGGVRTPVRMVATDLDGTLLRSDGTLSPRTVEVLRRATDEGLIVVPATGRPLPIARHLMEELDFLPVWVLANGAVTWDATRGEVVRAETIDQETAIEIVHRLRAIMPVVVAVEAEGGAAFESGFERTLQNAQALRRPGVDDVTTAINGPVVKILVVPQAWLDQPDGLGDLYRTSAMEEFYGQMAVALADLGAMAQFSGMQFLEIGAGTATKGSALASLAQDWGIAPTEVAAFGDYHNDLTMLTWAGRSYVTGHASADVRAVADEVLGDNDDDVVAAMVERFLAEGQKP